MKRWVNGFRLRAAWTRAGVEAAKSKKSPNSPIYVLEEGDMERAFPPESADERLQRVERTMLALTAEWLELTGRAEPPLPCEVDLSSADREALREVRNALKQFSDTPTRWYKALDKILAPISASEASATLAE